MTTPKTVPLTINEWKMLLAYDFNAICEAEPAAGCNLLAALENLGDLTAIQLRGLLYAGIVSTPRPSIRECGAMIRVDTIGPITSALATAYNLSIVVPAQVDGQPVPETAVKEVTQ